MSSNLRASLVVPAFNEAERISAVLEPALLTLVRGGLDEIIVVDDGSTDDTDKVADGYEGVTVLRHETNRGKGEAMHTGYTHARSLGSTALLFLDADLRNLTTEHINSLLQPVIRREASMTIGILERTKLQKALLMRWGALSGQRALPISLWESLSPEDRQGFRPEAALNARSRHQGLHRSIQRTPLPGVTHAGKREKEPTSMRAGLAYARTYGSALLTYARLH